MNIEQLGRMLIYVALFLASAPVLSAPGFFLTASDILFVLATGLVWLGQLRGRYIILHKVWLSWILGVVFIVVGLLVSSIFTNPVRGIVVSVQYMFALVLLPLLLHNAADRWNIQARSLAKWFILGLSFCALFGFVAYVGHVSFGSELMIGGRMGSLFDNPNTLAKMIGMSLPMALFFLVRERKWWALMFTLTALLGLGVASSFGGLGVAAITIVTFSVAGGMKGSLRLAVPTVLLGALLWCAIVLYGIPDIFEERIIAGIEEGRLGSIDDKISLMSEAVQYISANPIVGLGADMYREVSIYRLPVHNTYLLLWSEGGILSLVGLIILIVGSLVFGIRTWFRDKSLGTLVLSVLAGTVVAMITNTHVYGRFWFLPLIISMLVCEQGGKTQSTRGIKVWQRRRA